MSEIYDIHKFPKGVFMINFKIIDRSKQEGPGLTTKLKCANYQGSSFCGRGNIIQLITYANKILFYKNIKIHSEMVAYVSP